VFHHNTHSIVVALSSVLHFLYITQLYTNIMNAVRKLVIHNRRLWPSGVPFDPSMPRRKHQPRLSCMQERQSLHDGRVEWSVRDHGQPNAIKIRRIMPKGTSGSDKANKGTVVGFAGSTARLYPLERLEVTRRVPWSVEAILCGTCQGWVLTSTSAPRSESDCLRCKFQPGTDRNGDD
jgi:hypothetical protein